MAEFKLLPCPHCGSSKTYIKTLIFCRYKVICNTCQASGGACFTKQEAADAWNKRSMSEFEQQQVSYSKTVMQAQAFAADVLKRLRTKE